MEYKRAIEILKTEKECVQRASQCNRDCAECDLLLADDEILDAYDMAIRLIDVQRLHEEEIMKRRHEEEEKQQLFNNALVGLGFDPDKEVPSFIDVLKALNRMMEG